MQVDYNCGNNQEMTYRSKLRPIGKSTGLIIPKELLDRMNLRQGDELCVRETPNGYVVTPYDAELENDMELVDRFMSEYRHTMKKLAE